jgi:DNA primase
VFAFDGDRAGRAAAWRALQNALPEARRRDDCDSCSYPTVKTRTLWSAKKAKRRSKPDSTRHYRYPNIWCANSPRKPISATPTDGRDSRRLRDRWSPVPEGVYRELLVERLAESIKLPATRLRELWAGDAGGADSQRASAKSSTRHRARRTQRRSRRPDASGGTHDRASPESGQRARGRITRPTREESTEPGAEILRELVADLTARPCANTGALLERWRDPTGTGTPRTTSAATESLIRDDIAARQELETCIARMIDEARRRRLNALLERERDGGGPDRPSARNCSACSWVERRRKGRNDPSGRNRPFESETGRFLLEGRRPGAGTTTGCPGLRPSTRNRRT